MFGTKKEEKNEGSVQVKAARATKNDSIVMIDLNINGVIIKSCMLKEVECKEDGTSHKKGDICYIVNFPSEKANNGKWYNIVWYPLSKADVDDIVRQVKSLL